MLPLGWLGVAKVLCILRRRGVQLILAYNWARPALLVAGKGRRIFFLFLLFLHFHSFSSFFPVPLFHLLYYLFYLFLDGFFKKKNLSFKIAMSGRAGVCRPRLTFWLTFLAHLSRRLKVRYCDHSPSVVVVRLSVPTSRYLRGLPSAF